MPSSRVSKRDRNLATVFEARFCVMENRAEYCRGTGGNGLHTKLLGLNVLPDRVSRDDVRKVLGVVWDCMVALENKQNEPKPLHQRVSLLENQRVGFARKYRLLSSVVEVVRRGGGLADFEGAEGVE